MLSERQDNLLSMGKGGNVLVSGEHVRGGTRGTDPVCTLVWRNEEALVARVADLNMINRPSCVVTFLLLRQDI